MVQSHFQSPLPEYIQPVPSHIGDDELTYLRAKGALRLHSPAVRDKLWRSYFDLVHPTLPVLDRAATIASLKATNGSSKISLLLFHCVMLSSRLFLDAHEGRQTKPAALRAMFDRVRVLLDMGYETDRTVLIQCLLLMSLYPQPIDSPKSSLNLIAQAVSHAYVLGLHRNPALFSEDVYERSRRKQLWWSLYIRERMVLLDHGSPWLINERAHDVPMLTLDDFALDPLCNDLNTKDIFTPEHNASYHRKLALMLIERSKLAVVIGNLAPISTNITDKRDQPWPSIHPGVSDSMEVLETGKLLDKWVASLPMEVACLQPNSYAEGQSDTNSLLSVHITSLMLLYHIASNHWAVLRWFQVSSPTLDVSESSIKSLWTTTWPIIHLIDNPPAQQPFAHIQLLAPSLVRPLLLCAMLNRSTPFWLRLSSDTGYIPSLFERIGEADPYFKQAVDYARKGSGQTPTQAPLTPASRSSGGDEEPEVDASTMSPDTGMNVFDDMFNLCPSDIDIAGLEVPFTDEVPLADEVLLALEAGVLS